MPERTAKRSKMVQDGQVAYGYGGRSPAKKMKLRNRRRRKASPRNPMKKGY